MTDQTRRDFLNKGVLGLGALLTGCAGRDKSVIESLSERTPSREERESLERKSLLVDEDTDIHRVFNYIVLNGEKQIYGTGYDFSFKDDEGVICNVNAGVHGGRKYLTMERHETIISGFFITGQNPDGTMELESQTQDIIVSLIDMDIDGSIDYITARSQGMWSVSTGNTQTGNNSEWATYFCQTIINNEGTHFAKLTF